MIKDSAPRAAAIRALNDRFRQTLPGGTVFFTAGIIALGAEAQARMLAAVQAFDAFNQENDPWHEHDFGALEIDGERVFFKIDYLDRGLERHADNPADATTTERVMTVMLASEY